MGADSARKRTLWGSGAPEMGDLRLVENSSERGGALEPDVIVPETARGGLWHSERAGACQRALTEKRTHLSEVTALPLSPSQSLVMPSAV